MFVQPSFCDNSKPFDANQIQDLIPEMLIYWADELDPVGDTSFWKHGTIRPFVGRWSIVDSWASGCVCLPVSVSRVGEARYMCDERPAAQHAAQVLLCRAEPSQAGERAGMHCPRE